MKSFLEQLATAVWNRDEHLVHDLLSADRDQLAVNLNELFPWNTQLERFDASLTITELHSSTLKGQGREDSVYGALVLNLAVIRGSVTIVKLLLEKGSSPFSRDTRGRSPLVCAIYGSCDTLSVTPENYKQVIENSHVHAEIAYLLLEQAASLVDHKNADDQRFYELVQAPQHGNSLRGISPLCLAAYLGKHEMVCTLLEHGVSVDSTDANGASPLMYAGRDGHLSVVRLLLENGARVDLKDLHGWTAEQYAKSFPQVTTLLKEASSGTKASSLQRSKTKRHGSFGAALVKSSTGRFAGSAPIKDEAHQAASGLGAVIQPKSTVSTTYTSHLATVGASPVIHEKEFQLFSAVKNGNLASFKSALSLSLTSPATTATDVNFVDPVSGLTCLQYAARHRPLQCPETETMVRLLVSAGANVNSRNLKTGKTVLHYLLRDPYSPTTLAHEKRENESTLTIAPIKKMILSIMRFLHRCGVDANISDNTGNRPLHYAARLCDPDILLVLLDEFGVDAFVKNKKGRQALDECMSEDGQPSGNEEGVRVLSQWMKRNQPTSIYISNLAPGDIDSHTQNTQLMVVPVAEPRASQIVSTSEQGKLMVELNNRLSLIREKIYGGDTIGVVPEPIEKDSGLVTSQMVANSSLLSLKSLPISTQDSEDDFEETLSADLFDDYPDISRTLDGLEDMYAPTENTLISHLLDLLSQSEQRNKHLQSQVFDLQESTSLEARSLQAYILELEERLTESELRRADAERECAQWKEYAEDLESHKVTWEEQRSSLEEVFDAYIKVTYDMADKMETLSALVDETEMLREKFAHWEDGNMQRFSVQERIIFLEVQADLLRMNLQAICEKIKKEDDLLFDNCQRRHDLDHLDDNEDDGLDVESTGEYKEYHQRLQEEEEDIMSEISYLKRDQEAIQDQLELVYQKRNELLGTLQESTPELESRDQPKKRFVVIEDMLLHMSLNYCDVFREVNKGADSDDTLLPVGSLHIPPTSHTDYGAEFVMGPLLFSQLLDACRSRIIHLKKQLRFVKEERDTFLQRASESEHCSNQAAAAAQEAITLNMTLETQIKKLKVTTSALTKRLEMVQTRRMKEIYSIRECLDSLAGLTYNGQDDDELSLSTDEGILGQMRDLISDIDANLLVPLKNTISVRLLALKETDKVPESEFGQSTEDLNVYATQAITTLSTVTARLSEYVKLLSQGVQTLRFKEASTLHKAFEEQLNSPKGPPRVKSPQSRVAGFSRKHSISRRPTFLRKATAVKMNKIMTSSSNTTQVASPVNSPSLTSSSLSFDVLGHYAHSTAEDDDTSCTMVHSIDSRDNDTSPKSPGTATPALSAKDKVHQFVDAIAKLKSEIQKLEGQEIPEMNQLNEKKREHKRLVQELTKAMKTPI